MIKIDVEEYTKLYMDNKDKLTIGSTHTCMDGCIFHNLSPNIITTFNLNDKPFIRAESLAYGDGVCRTEYFKFD